MSAEFQVLRFLQTLEDRLPPPVGCHHNLTVMSGSLTLSVRYGVHWHTFCLDEWDIGSQETIKYVIAAANHAEDVHA